MFGWQPISTAPKDGSIIFGAAEPYVWVAFGPRRKWVSGRWCSDFGAEGWLPTMGEPTHWLPMHSPPTGD